MGTPKGLLPWRGRPLLAHHVIALGARASRVVVVLGARAAEHRAALGPEVDVVINAAWEHTHPVDSLALAVRELYLAGPAWVTPVDVLPTAPETLDALLLAGAPAVPVDPAGRDGHPVLVDAATLRGALASPPGGLQTLLRTACRVPVVDPHCAADFDTPAAWRHLQP